MKSEKIKHGAYLLVGIIVFYIMNKLFDTFLASLTFDELFAFVDILEPLLIMGSAVVILFNAVFVVLWDYGRHVSGKVLGDFGRYIESWSFMLFFVGACTLIFWTAKEAVWYIEFEEILMCSIVTSFISACLIQALSRLRICDNGMWVGSRFLKWDAIESFEWSNDNKEKLTVRFKKRVYGQKKDRTSVCEEHRDSIDELLSKFVSKQS